MKKLLAVLTIFSLLILCTPVPYAQAAGITLDNKQVGVSGVTSGAGTDIFTFTVGASASVVIVAVYGNWDLQSANFLIFGGNGYSPTIENNTGSLPVWAVFVITDAVPGSNVAHMSSPSFGGSLVYAAYSYSGTTAIQPDTSGNNSSGSNVSTISTSLTTGVANALVWSFVANNKNTGTFSSTSNLPNNQLLESSVFTLIAGDNGVSPGAGTTVAASGSWTTGATIAGIASISLAPIVLPTLYPASDKFIFKGIKFIIKGVKMIFN